ncbi:MAG: hypothetical protein KDJ90_20850 [Nitratireductor sp.]|nr:hypothetical protein [Nitratireductor sp.]
MARRIAGTLIALVALLVAAPQPKAQDRAGALAQAYNRTGSALFARLAREGGNIVLSPYSIGAAMAMASSGAREETAAQMAEVLGYPVAPAELDAELPDLAAALESEIAQQEGDTAVEIANALHLTGRGDLVSGDYRHLLERKFSAEIFEGSDLDAINDWVSGKTHGKIEKILSRLDPLSVCVLLNAVYFKGEWSQPFAARATAPAPFHLSTAETVNVPTMHKAGVYKLMQFRGADIVELPYKGGRLSMLVVVPSQAGGAGHVPVDLDAATIEAVVEGMGSAQPQRLALAMPKFRTEFGTNLIPPFRDMGMQLPFDQNRADFAGIVESTEDKDRIHISQIAHKAFIEVDENGTEAAASTAIEFAVRSAAPAATEFRIDRPFAYLIVDQANGAILFMGQVSDPRK